MNKNIKIIIFCALAVAVVVGASLLYKTLSSRYDPDKAAAAQTEQKAASQQETAKSDTANTETANTDPAQNNTTTDNTSTDGGTTANATPSDSGTANTGPADSGTTGGNTGGTTTPAPAPQNSVFSAPDFTVYDKNGSAVKLSSFNGKPIVVNFWASWCGYCIQEMPEFQAAYEKYGDDVVFLMVNLINSDTMQKAQNVIDQNGFTFSVYFDNENSASSAYPTTAIPASVFIGTDGKVSAMVRGAMTADRLNKYIAQIYPAAAG
ncbi:MAG: TlpA disulfide reductase family protein [Oscillibacter sp.]|nr:TlpA disulfide reductase family protein [Oscillibacter sp.]